MVSVTLRGFNVLNWKYMKLLLSPIIFFFFFYCILEQGEAEDWKKLWDKKKRKKNYRCWNSGIKIQKERKYIKGFGRYSRWNCFWSSLESASFSKEHLPAFCYLPRLLEFSAFPRNVNLPSTGGRKTWFLIKKMLWKGSALLSPFIFFPFFVIIQVKTVLFYWFDRV